MSNVLIGIIGVILFIGLALAGALFLGPRFQEATNNSRASAAVQGVAQVASAISMYQVQEGNTYATVGTPAANDDLLTKGYLKSLYKDQAGGLPYVASTYGGKDFGARYVILGGLSDGVCKAIQKQTNRSDATLDNPAGYQSGCADLSGNLVVFARV